MDLPLSWWKRNRNTLSPADLPRLTTKSLQDAMRVAGILQAMLAKSHSMGAGKGRFRRSQVDDFIGELGIDINWRPKNGGIDVEPEYRIV